MKDIFKIYREIMIINAALEDMPDDKKEKLLQTIPQELQEELKDKLKNFQKVIKQML